MSRLTEKIDNGFYRLAKGKEIYGEENGIRLVQIVGQLEDIMEENRIESPNELRIALKPYFKILAFLSTNDGIRHLKDLKAIEDELGIDLITLFKALKQGYVWVKENGLIEKNHGFCINETGIWSQVKLDPGEYGKTWALTKGKLK